MGDILAVAAARTPAASVIPDKSFIEDVGPACWGVYY